MLLQAKLDKSRLVSPENLIFPESIIILFLYITRVLIDVAIFINLVKFYIQKYSIRAKFFGLSLRCGLL